MPEARPVGTVLCFDYGAKRIGIATGETRLATAMPLTVLSVVSEAERLTAITRLIREWQPVQLVVGLPTHMDGTPHALTAHCHDFAAWLAEHFALPVALADERLTSRDAQSRLRECGHDARSAKAHLDAVAAQLILQTWFDSAHHDAPLSPLA